VKALEVGEWLVEVQQDPAKGRGKQQQLQQEKEEEKEELLSTQQQE
jgi:hypothetical protein